LFKKISVLEEENRKKKINVHPGKILTPPPPPTPYIKLCQDS